MGAADHGKGRLGSFIGGGPMGVWQPYEGTYDKSATYIIFIWVSRYYMQMDIVVE